VCRPPGWNLFPREVMLRQTWRNLFTADAWAKNEHFYIFFIISTAKIKEKLMSTGISKK
jgi:hypothetical protein